ncbi:Ig-like domain-containing protein [Marmoricola sp. RAF53]|uniref:Ig-like domain-containing protein n=1 Tax=Marmoricola sp. RAF53 TaxID=3233059 RepID=UPI003F99C9BE
MNFPSLSRILPARRVRRSAAAVVAALAVTTAGVLTAGAAVADPAPQTIDFPALSDGSVGGLQNLHAVADSGLPVSYTAEPAEVCSVGHSDANQVDYVHTLSPGTCTVTATQAGDGTTAPAEPVAQSFEAAAVISFYRIFDRAIGSEQTLQAYSVGTEDPVTFAASPADVCEVAHVGAADVVRSLAVGTCTVTASSVPGGSYAAAPDVSQTFEVSKRYQRVEIAYLQGLKVGERQPVHATTTSGLPLTYSVGDNAVCSIVESETGPEVVAVHDGSCTVTASQAGTAEYAAASSGTSFYIESVNTPPVVRGGATSQVAGSTRTLVVDASDVDAQTLTITTTNNVPANNKAGFSVTPLPGNKLAIRSSIWFTGVVRITVTVTDTWGATATATITDTVYPPAVTGLVAKQKRTGKATVRWKASPVEMAVYEIRVGAKVVAKTTAASAKIPHVAAGKKVTVTVLAYGTRSPAVSVKPRRA